MSQELATDTELYIGNIRVKVLAFALALLAGIPVLTLAGIMAWHGIRYQKYDADIAMLEAADHYSRAEQQATAMIESLRSVDSMTSALTDGSVVGTEEQRNQLSRLQNELIHARDSLAAVVDETTAFQINLDDAGRMNLPEDFQGFLAKNYITLERMNALTKQANDSFAVYNSMYDVYSLTISIHDKYNQVVFTGGSLDDVYDQAVILRDDSRDQQSALQRLVDAGVLGGDISYANQFVDGFADSIVSLVAAIQAQDYNAFVSTLNSLDSRYNDQAWNEMEARFTRAWIDGWSSFFESDINHLSDLLGQVTRANADAGTYYEENLM